LGENIKKGREKRESEERKKKLKITEKWKLEVTCGIQRVIHKCIAIILER
jgi:hypothetical protein